VLSDDLEVIRVMDMSGICVFIIIDKEISLEREYILWVSVIRD
jgi:hypothetical protein